MSSTTVDTRQLVGRSVALDAFRGAAILLMILDHVILVTNGPGLIRVSITRLAMPMFFLLAGHLVRRVTSRHVLIGLAGILVPLVVPWVDSPNVLVLWALGSAFLVLLRYLGMPLWLVAAIALTTAAQGWAVKAEHSYDVYAVFGLLALGSMLPRSAFAWAERLPGWVAAMGRHPIAWYLGHLAFLRALQLLGWVG